MAGTLIADKWQNGDGTENYKCRAWVNFNGTGTVAIRGAGNVSSITDTALGSYLVTMTNALADANYACVASADSVAYAQSIAASAVNAQTVSVTTGSAGGAADFTRISVSIFR